MKSKDSWKNRGQILTKGVMVYFHTMPGDIRFLDV